MSQYLIDGISSLSNVNVWIGAQVVGVEADDRLRQLVIASADGPDVVRLAADALFICIGGTPRSDPATGLGLLTDDAGYLLTGTDLIGRVGFGEGWPLSRQPLPLETNRPGLFAAGDVRHGSIKRCAAAIGEGAMAVALVHQRLRETGGD